MIYNVYMLTHNCRLYQGKIAKGEFALLPFVTEFGCYFIRHQFCHHPVCRIRCLTPPTKCELRNLYKSSSMYKVRGHIL